MSMYSYEEKMEAVLRVVETGRGYRSSVRIMKVHHSVVECIPTIMCKVKGMNPVLNRTQSFNVA